MCRIKSKIKGYGNYAETLLLLVLLSTPSWLKVLGWGGDGWPILF